MNTKDKTNPVEGVKERLAHPQFVRTKGDGVLYVQVGAADLKALLSDHTRLEAEVARLRAALEPFAREGAFWLTEADSCIPDSDPLNEYVKTSDGWLEDLTVGDLRRARTTLGDQ